MLYMAIAGEEERYTQRLMSMLLVYSTLQCYPTYPTLRSLTITKVLISAPNLLEFSAMYARRQSILKLIARYHSWFTFSLFSSRLYRIISEILKK